MISEPTIDDYREMVNELAVALLAITEGAEVKPLRRSIALTVVARADAMLGADPGWER